MNEAKAPPALGLTPKMERFAVAYCEHGSASKAYRSSYSADNMAASTVHREACVLLRHPKVSARLRELRALVAGAGEITLTSHLARLDWIAEQAAAARQYSAATMAEIGRAKAAGVVVDRVESKVSGSVGLVVSRGPDLTKLSATELEVLEQLMSKATPANEDS